VAEIKGTAVLDTLKAAKARGGESEMASILALLSEESRKVFESPMQASSWYPVDAFTEFLEADVRETVNGEREALIKRSEKVIESQLRGIYKIFVSFGSPRFVITASLPCTRPILRAYKSSRNWTAAVRPSNTPVSASNTALWNSSSPVFSGKPWKFPARSR
jgi:hypothetical protein